MDEMLDSADPSVGDYLVPDILRQANKSEAMVMISTHRVLNYKALQRAGWTILSPGYRIERGNVVPAHTINRGIPDPKINLRYIKERYEPHLKPRRR